MTTIHKMTVFLLFLRQSCFMPVLTELSMGDDKDKIIDHDIHDTNVFVDYCNV